MKKQIVVAASGYFDPLHIGHVEYLELAKKLGDKLVVIVNNDEQCRLKKGFVFMPQEERMKIIAALKPVDEVVLSIDKEKFGIHVPVSKTLEMINPNIFAKGGDRHSGEIPEGPVCKKLGIKIVDGLGKKIQASSELVKRAREIEQNNAKKTP
ncbi:FAD synthase [uncultured archaeon]|nr:FAD synthase [uncultured archaeon]